MKRQKAQNNNLIENIIHGVFLVMGLITVGCVLLITVYLVISGIPAIKKIGLIPFLFGKTWASTSSEPSFGILPFILTSVYGTAGAIVLGVPIGFLTAVYISKYAPKKIGAVMQSAVSLLALRWNLLRQPSGRKRALEGGPRQRPRVRIVRVSSAGLSWTGSPAATVR